MTKRVLICRKGTVWISEDRENAERWVEMGGCTVFDISRCHLAFVAGIACDYGWFFGKMPMYLENFGRRYEDYFIDTSDEDWWDNQVGK